MCEVLGGNGVCDRDQGCNSTACLWDMGDCGDVLAEVLKRAKLDGILGGISRMAGPGAAALASSKANQHGAARDPSSLEGTIAELVATQGGFVQQGMYVGLLIGILLALIAICVCCQLRAKRRSLQLRNRKYTPYGQADDDFGDGEPRLASAVDDDDDEDGDVHRDPVIHGTNRSL